MAIFCLFGGIISLIFRFSKKNSNYTKNVTAKHTQSFPSCKEPPFIELLNDVDISLHLIWSEDDKISPPSQEKIHKLIEQGVLNESTVTMSVVSNSSHYIQHEQSQVLADE